MAQRVREIMTANLRTCPANDSVTDAATVMRDEDVGDVIVLKDDGSMCGLVTDRDIAIRAVAEGRDPASTRLDEICSHDLETLSPDDDASSAAQRMRDRGVRRMPVTEDGTPVGMVSIGDLAIELDPDSALADISAKPGNA